MEILEILELTKDFEVTKTHGFENNFEGYEVESKHEEIGAIIYTQGQSTIDYFVTGTYDSGLNWTKINMVELNKLKEIAEYILKTEGNQ